MKDKDFELESEKYYKRTKVRSLVFETYNGSSFVSYTELGTFGIHKTANGYGYTVIPRLEGFDADNRIIEFETVEETKDHLNKIWESWIKRFLI